LLNVIYIVSGCVSMLYQLHGFFYLPGPQMTLTDLYFIGG